MSAINPVTPGMRDEILSMTKQPTRPGYKPVYDPATMGLYDKIQGGLNGIQVDKRGLAKFQDEAMRSGPSAWSRMQNAGIESQARQARSGAAAQAGSQAAAAASGLAMRGGITSGARERLAQGASRNFLDMSQQISRDEGNNKAQTGINDEQNRIQQLSMLGDVQNKFLTPEFDKLKLAGQANQFDIGNKINEGKYANDWNMNTYKEQMAAWAANRQADATAKSGKK